MTEKLFSRIEELRDEYTQFLFDIASIESPTSYKAGVDAVGAYVIEKARARGWEIELHKEAVAGDAIAITLNPKAKGAPVCFSAHMDTVHPVGTLEKMPVAVRDGKIYGPGVYDCKGGIASSFMAMAALEDVGFKTRPIKLILQSDEETGSRESEKRTIAFMCEKAMGAAAFLNCEPHKAGYATLSRKGILTYSVTVTGKAIHASECYNGISAINEAAHKIIALEKWQDAEGVTVCCGLISGGTAKNTVAEKCSFTIDIRYTTEKQLDEVKQFVRDITATSFVPGSVSEAVLQNHRVPMELTERNIQLLEKANTAFKAYGIPTLARRHKFGGSDAAYVTAAGIPCLDSLGVTGGAGHTKDEYAMLSSLPLSAKTLAVIALSFS